MIWLHVGGGRQVTLSALSGPFFGAKLLLTPAPAHDTSGFKRRQLRASGPQPSQHPGGDLQRAQRTPYISICVRFRADRSRNPDGIPRSL